VMVDRIDCGDSRDKTIVHRDRSIRRSEYGSRILVLVLEQISQKANQEKVSAYECGFNSSSVNYMLKFLSIRAY
jgi:hypothetical protein